ncbi:MAG: hypothetical protein HN636_00290 [Cryomorphaceae bacterium]|nr:hypothetical protein [Cryomorphaceae bacterium]
MRSLLSYFFLITLLFPSVVESVHAIHDSHDICDDLSIHFHEENQSCDLALYFSVDIDNNSTDFYLAQDFNYLLKESNSNSQNLFSNSSSSDIKYRGPPII